MSAIVFANARIIDGTGAKPFTGDVLVEGQVSAGDEAVLRRD